MRVAIDARELCGRPTGVGRYLAGLLEAWADNATARRHQWTLYTHAPPALPQRWEAQVRVLGGSGGTAWEQLTLPRALAAERPDVMFAPGYTAPLTVAAPLVLTVHDVSFFAHPEWFSAREGFRRRLLTAWAARRARTVITDSEFSRSEIARHIGIDPARLRVIPLGVERAATRREPGAGNREPGAGNREPGAAPSEVEGREPMVLYVGSIFERRRVDQLIEAFDVAAARVPGATLEIVGENRTRRPRLDLEALRARATHADRIHLRSYVDERTLRSLYRKAAVLAWLSEYEGFGLAPLEALAAGVAPLVLDTPVARETCGDAARYVSPDAGVPQIGQAIADLLASAPARHDLLQRAAPVLARYDWDLAAGDTLRILEEAAIGR